VKRSAGPWRPAADELGPADIAQLLADRVLELATEIFPGGKRYGRLFRVGSIRGEPGQSLVVELTGPRRGRWRDYNDIDKHGDMLDAVRWACAGGDVGRALDWSRNWLGLPPRWQRMSDDAVARVKADTARQQARNKEDAERRDAEHRRRARAIWDKARPLMPGDTVDLYLKQRGIDLSVLGQAPAALRFAPSLWAGPGLRCPAMIAAISDGAGRFIAVHRTFLQRQGDIVTKAPIEVPKRALAAYAGGSIKLWRGRSGKDWLHMPMGSTIVAGEGVEDALSALVGAEIAFPVRHRAFSAQPMAVSELRVIAAVSLANIGALDLPSQVARLVILAQRDPAGSEAARVLRAVIKRLEAQGIEILLLPPPAWIGVKDLNDLVRTLRVA
jgi:hypothetical protein